MKVEQESMTPPFSYYGGKQRLSKKILSYIPKHTVYVEPFCGAATILFKKPWPLVTNKDHYREYINDSNRLVTTFFNVLVENGDALCNRLSLTLCSEETYKNSYEMCRNPSEHSDLEIAVAFFVNIQMSFSNKLFGGWRTSVYSKNLSATWERARNLQNYIERMGSVGITNCDALKCITRFDAPQTFFYVDPPYPNAHQGHYSGFTQTDFNDLVGVLDSAKGSALVSCYNQDEVFKKCNSQWTKVLLPAYASSSGVGKIGIDRSLKRTKSTDTKRVEYLYLKQASTPRPEIVKLYESGKYDCFESRQGIEI